MAKKKTWIESFLDVDWGNPKNILIALAAIIMPFVAWYYVSTAFVIGLLMAVSILWLLDKSPKLVKRLVAKYPLFADIALSTTVVVMFGSYFGSGLTLGLGAVFTAVILSWGLQMFSERFKQQEYATANAI